MMVGIRPVRWSTENTFTLKGLKVQFGRQDVGPCHGLDGMPPDLMRRAAVKVPWSRTCLWLPMQDCWSHWTYRLATQRSPLSQKWVIWIRLPPNSIQCSLKRNGKSGFLTFHTDSPADAELEGGSYGYQWFQMGTLRLTHTMYQLTQQSLLQLQPHRQLAERSGSPSMAETELESGQPRAGRPWHRPQDWRLRKYSLSDPLQKKIANPPSNLGEWS